MESVQQQLEVSLLPSDLANTGDCEQGEEREGQDSVVTV